MSYEPVLLPKFSPDGTMILAKEQVHNLYTFWAMSILIFSPFANFGNQSLIAYISALKMTQLSNFLIICFDILLSVIKTNYQWSKHLKIVSFSRQKYGLLVLSLHKRKLSKFIFEFCLIFQFLWHLFGIARRCSWSNAYNLEMEGWGNGG